MNIVVCTHIYGDTAGFPQLGSTEGLCLRLHTVSVDFAGFYDWHIGSVLGIETTEGAHVLSSTLEKSPTRPLQDE